MFNQTNSYLTRQRTIEAWAQYVTDKLDQGWEGHLLTLKFHHIPGSEAVRLRIMEQELERVYAKLLTRLFRRPHAARNRGKLPIWLAAPDYPVAKHEKQLLCDILPNDGLHLHVVALFHPERRLRVPIEYHLTHELHYYANRKHELLFMHVEPIETEEQYVVGYGFKSVRKRASIGTEGYIVLPRTASEIKSTFHH